MNNQAVTYLRSSKDRSDVSIDAQRRALHELAQVRSLAIVGEFADAVESGKDDDRPGFQQLLAALRDPSRKWQIVLALDTSRVARRRALSLIFEEHECARRGVRVIYKSIPDTEPMTEMLLRSILQAMDEWHSLNSKAKGLAGMAENVRQGYRAGGRAPRGYRLEYIGTGAIRDGSPVLKSKLVVGDDAPRVAAYLRARAAGEPRGRVMARLRLDWPVTSLVGMEWQALTYAGHTAWGIHNERNGGAYNTGTKRKPRKDWLVTRSTHEPLITDDEAEAILKRIEHGQERRTRTTAQEYLLAGLLVTPDGRQWHGDSGEGYRVGKGRRIASARVDDAVLAQIATDWSSEAAIKRATAAVRAFVTVDHKRMATNETQLKALTYKIGKLIDIMAVIENPVPYQRRIAEMEAERAGLEAELSRQRAQADLEKASLQISEADVRAALRGLLDNLRDKAGRVAELRSALASQIDRVELDPETERCVIHYRLTTGVNLASPRGLASNITRVAVPVDAWLRAA